LSGPARATTEDGLLGRKSHRGGCNGVALLVVERNGLKLVTEKWRERRTVVDMDVDARVAASGVPPWGDLIEEMITDGN
jgi:hypothetical protein